jgi:large repetitive protein
MTQRRLILRTLEERITPNVGDLLFPLNPPAASSYLGYAIAANSTYIAVGASRSTVAGTTAAGSVDLFNTATGNYLKSLVNPTPAGFDGFGESVAISRDYVAVGAQTDDNDGQDVGIAYVFSASGGNLLFTLHNPTPRPSSPEFFGCAVAIAAGTVFVGAYLDDTDALYAGSVYKFSLADGSYLGRLQAPDTSGGDYFGFSLAATGDRLAVGEALGEPSGISNSGAAHVYNASTGALLQSVYDPVPGALNLFGSSVGLSGNNLVVGSFNHLNAALTIRPGSAYVFDAATGNLVRTLANPTPAEGDRYGNSVAVAGNTVIVGAPNDDTTAAENGSAYVFDAPSGNLLDTIDNPNALAGANFGGGVAASASRLYAGASQANKAYAFEGRPMPPPDAIDDTPPSVPEDAPSTRLNVLANDNSFDPDSFTVTALTQGAHGSVAISADGQAVEYTPGANYNGPDTFTYTVTDGYGTDTATVSVTVTAVNDPPNAVDDQADVPFNAAPTAIPVLANDSIDPDSGETLTITQVIQGAHGAVVITGGGTGLTYAPTAGYSGPDSFTYTISDGNGGTDTASVSITVQGSTNNPPDAVDDSATVNADGGAQVIDALANDTTAPDAGETLTIVQVTQGAHGTVIITGGGTGLTYAPAAGYVGPDAFTYTVSDGNGGTDTATVLVSVQAGGGGNNPPDAVDDSATLAEDGGAQAINVLANDSTAPDTGESLTLTAVTQGQHGAVTITGNGTGLTYTPDANFAGTDSFLYAVSDGNGGTDFAAVTVSVTNDGTDRLEVVTSPLVFVFTEGDPPLTVDPAVHVSTNNFGLRKAQVKISSGYVRGRDKLIFPLTPGFLASFSPATGTLTIVGNRTATTAQYEAALRGVMFTNTHPAPVEGLRTIAFTVSDALGTGDPAFKKVMVLEVNTPPKVTLTGPALTYRENRPAIAVAGTIRVSDLDNTRLAGATVAIAGGFAAGQDVLSFTAKAGITGSYDSSTGVLTLTGNATVAAYQAVLRTAKYRNVSDGPTAAARTLSFTVTDGTATSTSVTRTVNLVAVNDAPVLDASSNPTLPDVPAGSTNPPDTLIADLLGSAVTDPDLGAEQGIAVTALTGTGSWQYSLDGGSTWLTITAASKTNAVLLRSTDLIRFVPAAGFTGTATISYRAWDRTAGTAGATAAVGMGGGTTAFSMATETASVLVV